ncbi:unnamed protein product [Lactuca saligna]|uniref:Uncharacterized protein n=1 Tax=Lactuca saligna TaxID=75948 RepID=A0AA36EFQ5_LACSI|nr:unnamed protein product [Lactuca saligna]
MKSGPSEFDSGGNSVFLHSWQKRTSVRKLNDPTEWQNRLLERQILKLEGEISYIPVVMDINNKLGNEEGKIERINNYWSERSMEKQII